MIARVGLEVGREVVDELALGDVDLLTGSLREDQIKAIEERPRATIGAPGQRKADITTQIFAG